MRHYESDSGFIEHVVGAPSDEQVFRLSNFVRVETTAPGECLFHENDRSMDFYVVRDGAIEIRNVNGPAQVDTPYVVTGEVLAMGLSPKTELFWFETAAADESGKVVAEMRMLIRMMKASSPLWDEA